MFAKTLVLFPLLAAAAFAQGKDGLEPLSDRVVFTADGVTVATYGNTLRDGAMTLNISSKMTDDEAAIVVNGGQPGAAMTLLVSFAEARIDLSPLGVKSWLLVDPVSISATVALDKDGAHELWFDRKNPELAGKKIFVQAWSIENHGKSLELRSSQGLCFVFEADWQPAPGPVLPYEPKGGTKGDADEAGKLAGADAKQE